MNVRSSDPSQTWSKWRWVFLDALLHEFDRQDRRHMEYLRDHGAFAEFPYELSETVLWERFPLLMETLKNNQVGDMENEKFA